MNTWPKRPTLAALTALTALCALGLFAGPASAGTQDSTVGYPTAFAITGEDPGFVRQNAYISTYAFDVYDPDGVKSVAVDVSSIALPSGGYDISNFSLNGPYYGDDWGPPFAVRLKAVVPEGTYPWSVKVTDNNDDVTTQPTSVVVDNTKPTPVDVQTANGGAVVGKAELGDTITVTYTDNNGMGRRPAGDTPRNMVVRIDNAGSNDVLKLYNQQNSGEDPAFGQVKLGKDYVSANRTFGATGTKSTVVRSGNSYIVTLGTPSGSTNTVTSSGTMQWFNMASVDMAGNATPKLTVNETGAADREF